MPILVDSDVLIEISRERDTDLVARWRGLTQSNDIIGYSPVTAAELWQGAREKETADLENLFTALVCLPIDEAIGRAAGSYLRRFAKSHAVELGDALIAATAAQHEAYLWTRNRKHYPMKDIRFY